MTTAMIYFDTLQYVKTLEASGVPKKQAEAMAKAQQEALSECLDTTLVTKTDLSNEIAPIKTDISTLKSEVKWIQWVLGFGCCRGGSLVLKTFF